MEYAQVKGNEVTFIPEMPIYRRMTDDGLKKMGIYRYIVPQKPIYDPKTQEIGGPVVSFDGDKIVASWLLSNKDLGILRTIAKNRIDNSWNNDINTIGMPLQGYDFSVDYGVEDALIWQNSVDFLPEGATEVEVRAVDNSFHTIPIEVYYSVPALQKAYYAQQLQKKWNLQKAIDAATSAEEIEAITW